MKRPLSKDQPPTRRKLRLLLHAPDGCVPYLTPDILEQWFPPTDDLWIGLAVRDISVVPIYGKSGESKTSKKPRGYTFGAVKPDPWLLPYTRVTVPSFDLIDDNQQQKSKAGGANTDQHVLVWTPHGRQKLTLELYNKSSEALQSNYTLTLYDMNEERTSRRKEKAEYRNKKWFGETVLNNVENTGAFWSPVLLPNENDDLPESLAVVHESAEDIAGIALVGQWRKEFEKMIEPLQAPHVAILSTRTLTETLDIACTNLIDTIGTNLPSQWAKDKRALGVVCNRQDTKRLKSAAGQDHKEILDADGCLDLKDKLHARDSRPLVVGCTCMVCSNDRFSRAYVHHLVCAKELLAEILLFGHNLHHLLNTIRAFNDSEDREKLMENLLGQCSESTQGSSPKDP